MLHYGTKLIDATAMSRQEYNNYRGWVLPEDENGEDAGYLVEYKDGGATNHPDHKGYISWSPKEVFDAAYQPTTAMNFGHALEAIKFGKRVARHGWNGRGMFVFLVAGSEFTVNREPLLSILGEGTPVSYNPHVDIKQPDGSISTWQPSIGDIMADDWHLVG